MYQCISLWLIITVIMTLCVGHQIHPESPHHDDNTVKIRTENEFSENVSKHYDKMEDEKLGKTREKVYYMYLIFLFIFYCKVHAHCFLKTLKLTSFFIFSFFCP